ncbi:MAG: hypothetical protein EOP88_17775 [Verrucomicrobiaceae bacterium]|nr:MAG: hypothetical protein EOP88_17775 [Verrucomicrobiaceae bacterium]
MKSHPSPTAPAIRVRYESPEEPVFVGREIGLVFHGEAVEVVDHEIYRPSRTLLSKDGGEFEEICGSLRGVVRGHGPVPPNHSEAFIAIGGEERIHVPYGEYEDLTGVTDGQATWSFTFAYTVKPCGCSG